MTQIVKVTREKKKQNPTERAKNRIVFKRLEMDPFVHHPDRLAFDRFHKDTKAIEQVDGLALQVLITKENTSSE